MTVKVRIVGDLSEEDSAKLEKYAAKLDGVTGVTVLRDGVDVSSAKAADESEGEGEGA